MLADKDRIFLNLYGAHGADLESAKKRGAWNGTADMIAQMAVARHDQTGVGRPGAVDRDAHHRRRRLADRDIDGPAAAGKGTLAYREVARGYAYLLAFKTA